MNKLIYKGALAVAVTIVSLNASAEAIVTFAHPANMADVPRSAIDRENMEWHFREHFAHLSKQLPAGQNLKVEMLDIDLAGNEFPRVAIRDVRVLKGRADWPRLHLRYTIEQDGQAVRTGEAKLSNPNYLMGVNRYTHEMYSHEKQMVEDWWRKEVVAAH